MSESKIHRLRNLITIIMGGIETNNVQLSLEAVRRLEQELLHCVETPVTDIDYMLNVPVLLAIEVRSNDDDTFETNLCCALGKCGRTVDIHSHGPEAVQNVSCPKHGFLTSFPHRVALGEFVRHLANKILEKKGQRLIDAGASFIVGDEQPRPESINSAPADS